MSVATMHSPVTFPPSSPSTRSWNTASSGCGTGRKSFQISRCLFGPPDPQEAKALVKNMELQISLKFGERFNFDVISDKPISQPSPTKKMKMLEEDKSQDNIIEQAFQWTEADNQQLAVSFLFAPVVTNFINRYLSYSASISKPALGTSTILTASKSSPSKVPSDLTCSSSSSSNERNNNIATYPNKQDPPSPVAIPTTSISDQKESSSKISSHVTPSLLKSKRRSPYSTKRSSGKRSSSSSSIFKRASQLALHHMINKMNHAATTCVMTKKPKATSTITGTKKNHYVFKYVSLQ